jgi:hypothetical protein
MCCICHACLAAMHSPTVNKQSQALHALCARGGFLPMLPNGPVVQCLSLALLYLEIFPC